MEMGEKSKGGTFNLRQRDPGTFIARRELRINLGPQRVGSATDKSTDLWRIMEGLSTIKQIYGYPTEVPTAEVYTAAVLYPLLTVQ